MRFLFLALDVNLARKAGDAVHVRELCLGLARLGHSVVLIAAGSDIRDGGETVPVHSVSGDRLPTVTRRVLQIAHQSRPDVVYERRLTAKVGYALSRLIRTPLVIEVNGIPDREKSIMDGLEYAPSKITLTGRRFLLTRAKAVVAVSDSIRNALLETYGLDPLRVAVIPNGVNTDLFTPMDKTRCRLRIGLPNDEPILGFVGNLVPWQGVDILIRAVSELRRRNRRVRALIVGNGPDQERMQTLAREEGLSDWTHFAGPIPYPLVPTYIGAFDIGVSLKPPLLPGSPLKVREYMACGRPVIASRGTEYDFDVVEKANAGILVDPGRVEEIADSLESLLDDEILRTKMGLQGRSYAAQNCTWAITAKKVASICAG